MTAAFERGRSPEKADKVRKLQSVRLRENANKGGEGSKIGNFSEHHKWNAPIANVVLSHVYTIYHFLRH